MNGLKTALLLNSSGAAPWCRCKRSRRPERRVSHVCLRPENLTISESGDLRSKVARVTYMGGKYLLETVTDCGARLFAETRARFDVGAQLGLTITTPWAFSED